MSDRRMADVCVADVFPGCGEDAVLVLPDGERLDVVDILLSEEIELTQGRLAQLLALREKRAGHAVASVNGTR